MTQTSLSPFGAVIRGLLAAAIGTAAMDLLSYGRYRYGGGESSLLDWEFSAGLDNWEDASAPAKVGKRLYEGFTQEDLPPIHAARTSNLVHWMYGVLWGGLFGLIDGSLGQSRVRHGLLFGPLVWANGYVMLPLAKLYKPIWEYDPPTLGKDLGTHVVYGLTTAAAFRALRAL